MLPTLSARPVGIDAKVFRFDDDLDALVDFRRHVDAGKRCMSALRLVKWGDPHQTMHSDFTREETESILACHGKRCRLQPGFLTGLIIVENRLEALLLSPSQIHALAEQQMKEHFQLLHSDTVERAELGIRPGNVLVTVRDYNTLSHLKWVLERIDTKEQDVVVMSARVSQFGAAAYDLSTEQIFSDYEQRLFTRTVSVAENFGKHVSLLVVPAVDVWSAIVQTASNLESSAVVSGLSSKMTGQEQAFALGRAWEASPEPKRQFVLQIVHPDMIAWWVAYRSDWFE